MIVIADSNLIFSCLYTPRGVVASIIKSSTKIQFIAPDIIFKEVGNHLPKIVEYTGKTQKQVVSELKEITKGIRMYSVDEIPKKHILKAADIVKDIDLDDTFFVALHFHQGHKIWTGDTKLIEGLKKKGYDICITTSQLKKNLYKK